MAFALANHKSGESADEDTQHAKDLYEKQKGHIFTFWEEYKVLRVNQKWMLDVEHAKKQARRCADLSQQPLVMDRLERLAKASPTSKNSSKPQGVKKAILTKSKVSEQAEEKVEERRMSEWLESFSHRAQEEIMFGPP